MPFRVFRISVYGSTVAYSVAAVLVYGKVDRLDIHTCPLLFEFPSRSPRSSERSSPQYTRLSLGISFIHSINGVYMSISVLQSIPPLCPPWRPLACSLCLCVCFCFANRVIYTIFSGFHIYVLTYDISFSLSDSLHSVCQSLDPSMPLQVTQFHSLLWLSSIPPHKCNHIFFTHSSIDGHFDCFHVLAIVNGAAVNLDFQWTTNLWKVEGSVLNGLQFDELFECPGVWVCIFRRHASCRAWLCSGWQQPGEGAVIQKQEGSNWGWGQDGGAGTRVTGGGISFGDHTLLFLILGGEEKAGGMETRLEWSRDASTRLLLKTYGFCSIRIIT